MNKIIEFESEYGLILVEVDDENSAESHDFSNAEDKAIIKSKTKFETSLNVLQSVSQAVITKLNETADILKPDEIEVKVGLKFTAEAGAIIAKSGIEGNIEVVIKWKNEKNQVNV